MHVHCTVPLCKGKSDKYEYCKLYSRVLIKIVMAGIDCEIGEDNLVLNRVVGA